nr:MAG TPA: hypothetical protein [Caudoviricetes sp.]
MSPVRDRRQHPQRRRPQPLRLLPDIGKNRRRTSAQPSLRAD